MKSKIILNIFLFLLLLGFMLPVRAELNLQLFLADCAYGAMAGAAVGAGTLLFAEDPGNDLNPLARGTSLGLYLGIAVGLLRSENYSTPRDEGSIYGAYQKTSGRWQPWVFTSGSGQNESKPSYGLLYSLNFF